MTADQKADQSQVRVLQAHVQGLFIRRQRREPLGLPTDELILRRGYGIEGELHAHPASPRQALVVRKEDIDGLSIAPGALGENLLIAGLADELFVPGALLRIGASAALRLTMQCEPCKVIRPLVPSLSVLAGRRGLLAVVFADGTVRAGDQACLEPGFFAPLPEKPAQRCLDFVRLVPPGQVVTYGQIMHGMGVASSYARAIPGYLRQARAAGAPVHRVVDSRGCLIEAHVGPDQAALLAAEGVTVPPAGCVDLARYGWVPASLYLV